MLQSYRNALVYQEHIKPHNSQYQLAPLPWQDEPAGNENIGMECLEFYVKYLFLFIVKIISAPFT